MQVNIADIPISIEFKPGSKMSKSRKLIPFLDTGISRCPPSIIIKFIPEAPDKKLYIHHLQIRHAQPHLRHKGDELLFTFSGGQFLTTHDFARIKLWVPSSRPIEPEDDFEGIIWLLLILWGKISVSGGCFLHGAIVVVDGQYVLMLGNSGVGKSTIGRLAVQSGYTLLTEENPFLTLAADKPWVHATPWPGIFGPPVHMSGPLTAVFFLRHSPESTISKLSPVESGHRLITNARMFNWLPQTIPGVIELLDKTISSIPVYDFGFLPDSSAITAIKSVL